MTENPSLSIERTSAGEFIGRSERGGVVKIGRIDVEGSFTPGELLQIALGACGLLSSEGTLADKLGTEFTAVADVAARKSEDGSRYAAVSARIAVDASALEPVTRAALLDRAERAIAKRCTVGLTLGAGAEHTTTVVEATTTA